MPQQPGEVYVVTLAKEETNIVARTLAGEYTKKGTNHERPVFQKKHDNPNDPDAVDVLLYYWDGRDGEAFQGWWFGNKLGGTKVWAHCSELLSTPPPSGWKIPWDGPVYQTISVATLEAKTNATALETVDQITAQVSELEFQAAQVLEEQNRPVTPSASTDPLDAMRKAERAFSLKVVSLSEMMRKVTATQRTASGEALATCQQISRNLQAVHTKLTADFINLRQKRRAADEANERRLAAEQDAVFIEELRTLISEKVDAAVDLVEKTLISAEVISSCQEDQEAAGFAITETENVAGLAQGALRDAKMRVAAKRVPEAGQALLDEVNKLMEQIEDAQKKLEPLKSIRRTWEQRRSSVKLVREIEDKMALAELECDSAIEVVSALRDLEGAEALEALREAQQVVGTSEGMVNSAVRLYDTRVHAAKDVVKEELEKLGPRCMALKEQGAKIRQGFKEAGEKSTANSVVHEATEKMHVATEALAKLEGLLAAAVEPEGGTFSLGDMLAALRACESTGTEVRSAISTVRIFLQTKTAEVKRLSSGAEGPAIQQLEEMQRQLDSASTRFEEIKADVTSRRQLSVVAEAEANVVRVEELVGKVKEVAAILADDKQLEAFTEEEIRATGASMATVEKDANEALTEARRMITGRQVELRSKPDAAKASASLTELQNRLAAARTDLGVIRRSAGSAEQKLATRRLIAESRRKLEEVEGEVAAASALVAALVANAAGMNDEADGGADPASVAAESKKTEIAVQAAYVSSRGLVRTLEMQLRTQPTLKHILGPLEVRGHATQATVDEARASLKDHSERQLLGALIREVDAKSHAFQLAVGKASDLELESNQASRSAATLVSFDQAIQEATLMVGQCKTFVSMKRLSLRALSETAMQTAQDTLAKMQSTVEETMKRLQDMRNNCLLWKQEVMKMEHSA
eukprot:TRINITY_DN8350_c0_g1_i2.p1 TRINITY_DN8350_c0_g1~~TRINITY_DN8350_c0_g1_i2.p1  ORF type:complete len:986 (+),score=266.36 TRINITY_DN8350_c0_g1_i2:183-2960(+)